MLISLLDKLSQASVDSTVGFWLLTKGVNDIFNEHCRIPSDLPTVSCQFPQGQDLAAGHHLPGLVQGSPSHGAQKHTCVPGQVHTRASWHKAQTTSLEGDNLLFGILFRCLFKLLMIPLF